MASYNLGQVAIVDKGTYSSSANYDVLNQVSAHGGSFICVQPCSNIEPTVTTGWQNYWHPTAVGIKNVTVAANSSNKVVVTINLSDGTQYVSSPLEITAIATGVVGATQLAESSVTEAKIGSQSVNLATKVKGKLPIANGGTNATTAADARTNLDAQQQHSVASITINTGDWSNKQCVKSVSEATASNTIIASPSPASFETWGNFGVRAIAQANGTVTFACTATPTSSISVNILILN